MNNNKIQIRLNNKTEISNLQVFDTKLICSELTLSNPAYYRMLNCGMWVGKTPKEFRYYYWNGDKFIVPKAFIGFIIEYLKSRNLEYDFIDERVLPKIEKKFEFLGELRDYQKEIIKKVTKKEIGVIQASTGSGKSIMACYLAMLFQTNTLIVTTRTLLLEDFAKKINEFMGLGKDEIGIIQGQKFNLRNITLASADTLSKKNLDLLKNEFGLVIFDEVHQMITPKRQNILESFNSKYHYGMSATPQREDGKTKAVFFLSGRKIVEYKIQMMNPKIHIVRTQFEYDYNDDYSDMITELCKDQLRNETIVKNMKRFEGIKLILTKRREHCWILKNMIGDKATVLNGDIENAMQKMIKDKLQSGKHEWEYVIGTYSLISTGFDVPQLSVLGLAGDVKGEILTTQSIGRILRIFKGKNPVIVDFFDENQPILKYQFYNRKRLYNKLITK